MPFRQSDGQQGVARLAMPLTDVDRTMAQLHLALLIAAVLGLGVAVLMSSAAAHLAVRSLQKLTTTAHRMALGDLGTRARPEGQDELAVLGRDINSLTDSLSRALTELGLIDEYEFVVHPRLAGHGPTLFAGLSKPVALKLVSRLKFGSGAVVLRYEPRR